MKQGVPFAVFAVTFVVCVVLAAPSLTWLDGGELSLAAGTMGVSHPPGQPAWLVLAKLASLLPVGDLPFRLTLLSALTVSVAAALLAAIVTEAAGRLTGIPGAGVPLAGLVAGLSFGLAPAAVLQGVRPELYGLTIALGLASVRLLQMGGRRGVALAVIPLAVAGAVHHAMLVAAIPGLVLLASGRGRGSMRFAFLFAVLLVLPALGQFAWLPLRSATDPALDFGSPRTWDRVVHHVTAAGYARSFRPESGQVAANVVAHLRMALVDLGPIVLGLALLAVRPVWRARRRYLLAAVLLVVVGVLPTVLQGLFREDNPDARGYLLGPFAVLCAGAGVGAAVALVRIRGLAPHLAPWVGVAVLAGATVVPGLASLRTADHAGRFLPARLGNAMLDGAVPGSFVLPGGDSWALSTMYLRYWEGRRPDVHVLPLHMLEPGALPALAARGVPVPASVPPAVAVGAFVPEQLLGTLADRGVVLMVNEVWLPPDLLRQRRPVGLLYRLGGPPSNSREAEGRLWEETLKPTSEDPRYADDPIGPGVLGRRHGSRGGYHRGRGEQDLAGDVWRRGSALEPDDSAIIQLMRWRFDEGMESGAYSPAVLQDAARAQAAAAAGDTDSAADLVTRVLRQEPLHHECRLLAERLYSLGVHAAPSVPAP